jgi:hypothetical protein
MSSSLEISTPAKGISIDAKVFLATVVGGFLLMTALKLARIDQVITTIVIAGVVVLYSVIVVRMKRLHLRLDQAGDNAYYLGLIYTLFSMGWALWEIGKRLQLQGSGAVSVAETVIGDFGLALGTTLAGIICRIVLHQMRVDPADVENESRIRLAEAASKMIAQMTDVTSSFGEFQQKLQQKQQDYAEEMAKLHKGMREQFQEHVQQAVANSIDALRETSTQVSEAIGGFANATTQNTTALQVASDRLIAVEPPPSRLSERFDMMSEKVAAIADSLELVSEKLLQTTERMSAAANDAAGAAEKVSMVAGAVDNKIGSYQIQSAEVTKSMSEAITELQFAMTGIHKSAGLMEEQVARTTDAVQSSEKAAIEVLDRLTGVVSKLDGSIAGVKELVGEQR